MYYFSLMYYFQPFSYICSCKELSFVSSKDLSWQPSTDSDSVNKQILISYVRAEAAQHALTLKEQLSALGFSVYLVSFLVMNLRFLIFWFKQSLETQIRLSLPILGGHYCLPSYICLWLH